MSIDSRKTVMVGDSITEDIANKAEDCGPKILSKGEDESGRFTLTTYGKLRTDPHDMQKLVDLINTEPSQVSHMYPSEEAATKFESHQQQSQQPYPNAHLNAKQILDAILLGKKVTLVVATQAELQALKTYVHKLKTTMNKELSELGATDSITGKQSIKFEVLMADSTGIKVCVYLNTQDNKVYSILSIE